MIVMLFVTNVGFVAFFVISNLGDLNYSLIKSCNSSVSSEYGQQWRKQKARVTYVLCHGVKISFYMVDAYKLDVMGKVIFCYAWVVVAACKKDVLVEASTRWDGC